MRIFITGGTGLVGQRLVPRLLQRGDQVAVLPRRADAAQQLWGQTVSVVQGDPVQPGPWQDALAEGHAVVNLVGEGVFNRRWTAAYKEILVSSRVKSTDNVVAALASQPKMPGASAGKVLVNASAIGFFGFTGDEELTENSPRGDDTLARLCIEWEKAAQAATTHGCRAVMLRIGVVLDRAGGALKKMLLPFKMFAGGPIGSGKQFVSWIHHADLVGLILLALDNPQALGAMNATAPQPVTNRDFSRALGRALHRPSFLPTPSFALRLALGEVAALITKGQRVLPRKALELGYKFQFDTIDA